MIVSRNTDQMTNSEVARAAIESGAENLSDGVVAPAFWFLIAGAPGILVYKLVNTADSMIGYRSPRYASFGWAAARLDDVLNFVPARLTAILILLPDRGARARPGLVADARSLRSPNAGWPEAAMARRLDVALAGPRRYDGQLADLAWVFEQGRKAPGAEDVDRSVTILWQVWGIVLLMVAAVAGIALISGVSS
jgi:adenosylcobinamide-phosphate synthase